ncbi:hypothetical protein OC834_002727 [Tilletia horrida]|nr:hypothetical protein OC834_002727 [Tilletia horrida]
MRSTPKTTTPRRLLFKMDALLMPILVISYGLQYYDKAILGSASLFGILKDLELATPLPNGKTSLTRYSTATSAFYWGYIMGVLPLALLLQRMRLNLFLGGAVLLWGAIAILTPVVQNYHGLVAQRFFLGAVESAVSPGFVLVTRMWYVRDEHPVRLGICSATGLFSIFSGLVNYGIGKAASKPSSGIAAWKAMYLFAGGLTMFFGIVVLLILPPSPQRDALLKIPGFNKFTLSEKAEFARRTRADQNLIKTSNPISDEKDKEDEATHGDADDTTTNTGSDSVAGANQRAWSKAQVIEALSDYKIYIYFLQATALYITNGGVTAFGPLILKSFGYTPLRSIILQTPAGATTAVGIYITTYLARKTKHTLHALLALSCLPTLAGAIMIWKSDWSNRATPLAGFYLLSIFGAPFVLVLSSATANVKGSTKQSITSGAIFLGYNVGNIAAPYLVKAPQAPQHYRDCFLSIIICMCITIVLSAILAVGMHRQNAARDREQQDALAQQAPGEKQELSAHDDDLTDWQDRRFRYTL